MTKTLKQFIKFGLIGGFNTLLDLGVLNLLMWASCVMIFDSFDFWPLNLLWASCVTTGVWFSIFKTISFTVAVGNSYWLNKYWTFRDRGRGGVGQVSQFLLVSIVGAIINVGVATFIVNAVRPMGGVVGWGGVVVGIAGISMSESQIWANAAALLATAASMIWNFTIYKLVVFKEE